MRPLPRALAIALVICASLMLALGLLNLVINTHRPGSWLPLILIMPWSLYVGIWSLRHQHER